MLLLWSATKNTPPHLQPRQRCQVVVLFVSSRDSGNDFHSPKMDSGKQEMTDQKRPSFIGR